MTFANVQYSARIFHAVGHFKSHLESMIGVLWDYLQASTAVIPLADSASNEGYPKVRNHGEGPY